MIHTAQPHLCTTAFLVFIIVIIAPYMKRKDRMLIQLIYGNILRYSHQPNSGPLGRTVVITDSVIPC